MDHGIIPLPRRLARRTAPVAAGLLVLGATASLVLSATAFTDAFAQQQPAKPAAEGQQKAEPQQPENVVQLPQLLYSEWIKFCVTPGQDDAAADGKEASAKDAKTAKDAKGKEASAPQICLTGIDGRMESGQPIVAVVAIEPKSEGQKILRITLPVGMHLQHGTRFIIDKEQPLTAPYVTCFPNGCISDYELNADVIAKLKKGKQAHVQGINYDGSAISVPVPLQQFAKAYDGPPTDPKVLAERQKKLEDELKRKGEELKRQAEEARKKLEQSEQQPAKPKP